MNLSRLTRFVQDCDTKLQRWRAPDFRRVLVYVRAPMNFIVMAPVYRRMANDARVKFFFTASEDASREADVFREAEEGLAVIKPSETKLMKFDACLAADFIWLTLPRGTRRVQMFHGVAGKYANVYDTPEQSVRGWDRLFFINRRRLQNFIRVGAIDADSRAARLVGMPKVDCLVDGSLSRNAVLEKLGIDPQRKVILYAPTWSAHSSLVTMGQELVERLVSAGYAVIVKLHDRSHDPEEANSGGVNWVARLGPLLQQSGGHLATGSDSCPYLAAADVMITDHSSIGFEYLLLDRPLVRIEVPSLLKEANVNPEYIALLADASLSVRTVSETLAAVERSLTEPGWKSETRRVVASDLFHSPGNATALAVKELYELLELPSLKGISGQIHGAEPPNCAVLS
ncbi:MAG TPA: CDP-glycerol glycerophosphotransferase family protein [Pyrinomonadaceae bacterium]|nr:CDP-glycerol glycerophosphotransferase family protein [Pyrinomonadaceae bacterium]